MYSIKNKTALVTGAAHRLGKEFALFLAKQGCHIALHYGSSKKQALETQQEILNLNVKCILFQTNLQHPQNFHTWLNDIESQIGPINILINSASVYDEGKITNTSLETLQRNFQINLFTPILLSQSFSKLKEPQQIINITDNKTQFIQQDYAAYLLSKKSLVDFTLMAAVEFSPKIRVNCISPGVTLPIATRSDDYLQWRYDGIPLRKQGSPEHILKALDYLLTNDFVTGQNIIVDGGEGQTLRGRNSVWYQERNSRQQT